MRSLPHILLLLAVLFPLGLLSTPCLALELPKESELEGTYTGRAENGLWQLVLNVDAEDKGNTFEIGWMTDDPTRPTNALVGNWMLSGRRLKLDISSYSYRNRKELIVLTLEEQEGRWALRMPNLPSAILLKELPRKRALLTKLVSVHKGNYDAQICIGEFALTSRGEIETDLLHSTAVFDATQGPLILTLFRELTFDHVTPEAFMETKADAELPEPMVLNESSGPVEETGGRLVMDRSYEYHLDGEDHVGWNCMIAMETSAPGGLLFYDFSADIRCDGVVETGWKVLDQVKEALRPLLISSDFEISGSEAAAVAVPTMTDPDDTTPIHFCGQTYIPVAETKGGSFSIKQYIAEGENSENWTRRLAIWHRADADDPGVEVRLVSRGHAAYRKGRKSEYWEGKSPTGRQRFAASYTEFREPFVEWAAVVGEKAPDGNGIVLYHLVVRAEGDEDLNRALRNLDYGRLMKTDWPAMQEASFESVGIE